jgi:hypothetical protein
MAPGRPAVAHRNFTLASLDRVLTELANLSS